jgi:hypothetical protein
VRMLWSAHSVMSSAYLMGWAGALRYINGANCPKLGSIGHLCSLATVPRSGRPPRINRSTDGLLLASQCFDLCQGRVCPFGCFMLLPIAVGEYEMSGALSDATGC